MDDHHKTTSSSEAAVIEHRAYASDVYYRRTISFTAGNFWATVRLQPFDDLVIQPRPTPPTISSSSDPSITCQAEMRKGMEESGDGQKKLEGASSKGLSRPPKDFYPIAACYYT
ncbi:uncharacterized protein LOC126610726 isoform X2 [Malus sylvestris]|uniref:uncharacterized protein LOC126610726 isoform X2 n=1 Tax=Malus sylvestris TaxID=3752 RepID=UPI0021ABA927|nr:uncharacterized protein LOC126610726 isoform X2 [Malus sylvestris]